MKLYEVVEQFLIDCKVRGLTDLAIGFYRQRLTFLVRKLEQKWNITDLEQVKIAHLRQFVRLLMETKADENNPHKPTQDKPLSAFTIRGYVRAIKRLFSWCVDPEDFAKMGKKKVFCICFWVVGFRLKWLEKRL